VRSKDEILEWEGRRLLPAGLATFAGVALVIASAFVIGSVSGDDNAELLRSAYENSSSVTLSSILQAVGFVLLVAPLVVLFRAAAARSDRMRYQLIGLVVAAPLFLAASAVLNAVATNDAAKEFVAGNAKPGIGVKAAGDDCQAERDDLGAEEFGEEFDAGSPAGALKLCRTTLIADEAASNAVSEAPTRDLATGLGLGGRLGLAVALFYSCLYALRTGLLSRFWGSLGMALGVAALLLLVQDTRIWFLYFGLLLIGRLPGGRPPAWSAGEPIPWPTPGDRAAASMEPTDPDDSPSLPPADGSTDPSSERRKRKQRD
jgi:hypothetical protein